MAVRFVATEILSSADACQHAAHKSNRGASRHRRDASSMA